MTIREGKWKCPGCREVNRGSVEKCAGCGATRDAHTKFFFDENDAPVVTDAAELKKATAGPDWVCTFCDNSNPSAATTCTGCNAPKSAKAHAHGDVTPVGGVPVVAAAIPVAPGPAAGNVAKTGAKVGLVGMLLGALFLFCCCSGIVFLGRSHEDVAKVAQVAWHRSIDVQAIRPVQGSDWDTSPPGAYNVTHTREVRAHKQVQRGTKTVMHQEKVQVGSHKVVTGHKDLGNGRFEDVEKDVADYEMKDVPREEPVYVQEPVYGEHYYYTLDQWTTVRTPEAGGTTEPPRWPDAQLQGKEREGQHHESYEVSFEVKGQQGLKTLAPPSEADFLLYRPGTTWKIKWSGSTVDQVIGAGDGSEARPHG